MIFSEINGGGGFVLSLKIYAKRVSRWLDWKLFQGNFYCDPLLCKETSQSNQPKFFHKDYDKTQIEKFAECTGDLSYVKIACAALFVSLNNSLIVFFCCFTRILQLEPQLKFKVCGREIGRARQTFQSGIKPSLAWFIAPLSIGKWNQIFTCFNAVLCTHLWSETILHSRMISLQSAAQDVNLAIAFEIMNLLFFLCYI